MIQIAICDDDANVTENIHRYIQEKGKQLKEEALDVSIFDSGVDFLRTIDSGLVFHIVFMDIQMDGVNGIEVGKILRSKPDGDDTILIFISYHDCYYEKLAQVGSFRFLKKPISIDKLDDVFSRALRQAIKYKNAICAPGMFEYKIGTDTCFVRIDEIVYMKNAMRMIELYAWDAERKNILYMEKFYSALDEAKNKLPDNQFIRCSRSHIINLNYVNRMEKDHFIFMDEKSTRVSIGRVYKKEAKRAYFRYEEDMM